MNGNGQVSRDGRGSPAVTKMTVGDRHLYHDFETEEDLVSLGNRYSIQTQLNQFQIQVDVWL